MHVSTFILFLQVNKQLTQSDIGKNVSGVSSDEYNLEERMHFN